MRLNPSATRAAYVARLGLSEPVVMVLDLSTGSRTRLGVGQDPRWASADDLVWRPQTESWLRRARAASDQWTEVETWLVSGNSLDVKGSRVVRHRTDPTRVLDTAYAIPAAGEAWPVLSSDGRLRACLWPDRPAERMQSVRVLNAEGVQRTVWEGSAVEPLRMAGTTLCWRAADGHVYGIVDISNPQAPVEVLARPDARVSQPVPVYVPGVGLYVLHVRATSGERGRVCVASWGAMLSGSARGWVVAESGGSAYDHDLGQHAGRLIVAYQGDAEPAIVERQLVNFPSDDLAPPVERVPVGVPVSEPKALGYFYDFGKYGDHDGLARNCTVLGVEMFASEEGGQPVYPPDADARFAQAVNQQTGFIAASHLSVGNQALDWARVRGVWVHEPADADAARIAVAEARSVMRSHKRAKRPVVVVLRADRATDPQFAGTGDALAPQCYLDTPASSWDKQLTASRALVAAVCAAFPTDPLYLCVQAYDRATAAWAARPDLLEAIQAAANEELRRAQVKGLWWFSYGRPGGVLTYPPLRRWHEAQVHVTSAPPLPTDPIPEPPQEPPMARQPRQDEIKNALARLHIEGYIGELRRVGGIFESPKTREQSLIRDDRPGQTGYIDDDFIVHLSTYLEAFAASNGDHEQAVRVMIRTLHDSHEARTKRGDDPQ